MNLKSASLVALLVMTLSTAADADQLVIVAGASSGRDADRTQTIFAAASDAIAALNASGGVLSEKLVVERAEDGCERETAATAAAAIAARRPALVLGHPCAPPAIAAADVYGKAAVLFIATATRAPGLTAKRSGPTIFRLAGRDDAQGELAGRLLARAPFGSPVAIVNDRSKYGRELGQSAAAVYKREVAGAPITATVIGGDKDYRLTIAKVKDAAIIYFAGFPLEAGLVYKALRAAGSPAEFIGSDTLATEEFASTFGADAKGVRALVSSAAWSELAPQPGVNGPTRADADPAIEALRVKSAIAVFAAAASKAKSLEATAIAATMSAGAFISPLGPISFSSDGDARIPSFQLVEWRGDEWTAATPAPLN